MEIKKNSDFVILIIDDETTITNTLAAILIKDEFNVISASDSMIGLNKALEEKPDLILLDISMPKMTGMEMLKKLRESGEYGKNVKVILLTSLTADDKIMKGIVESQPSFYLTKSTSTTKEIISKIKEALGIQPTQI